MRITIFEEELEEILKVWVSMKLSPYKHCDLFIADAGVDRDSQRVCISFDLVTPDDSDDEVDCLVESDAAPEEEWK